MGTELNQPPEEVSEIVWLRSVLAAAGVAGANNLAMFSAGSFVSTFDERAAAPILLRCLPSLSEPWLVGSVVRHLRHERANRTAFEALLRAYRQWTPRHSELGSEIGRTLIVVAVPSDREHVAAILDLVSDPSAHGARRWLVDGLWRRRKDERVLPVMVTLCSDDEVCDLAMPALRRAIGNDDALPVLARLRDTSASDHVRVHAARQARLASNNLRRGTPRA